MDHVWKVHKTTLSDIQLRALANRNCRTPAKLFPLCPLCGENETHGQMESHITGHLRSLALKSLPSYQVAIPDDMGNSNGSVGSSKQQSRSTIKSFMDFKETHEFEEDEPGLVEQAYQSNGKNFLGGAHLNLGQLTSQELVAWDTNSLKELAYNSVPWNPEEDKILQSISLGKRKQDAVMQTAPERGQSEPHLVVGTNHQEQVEILANDMTSTSLRPKRGEEAECKSAADFGSSGTQEKRSTVESKAHPRLEPQPRRGGGGGGGGIGLWVLIKQNCAPEIPRLTFL